MLPCQWHEVGFQFVAEVAEPALRRVVHRGRADRLHCITRIRQKICCPFHRRLDLRIDGVSIGFGGDTHPQRFRFLRPPVKGYGHPEGITGIALGNDARAQTHIPHFTANDPLHGHQLRQHPPFCWSRGQVGRHTSKARLDGRQPAVEGRKPQRTADVIAVMDRTKSGCRR